MSEFQPAGSELGYDLGTSPDPEMTDTSTQNAVTTSRKMKTKDSAPWSQPTGFPPPLLLSASQIPLSLQLKEKKNGKRDQTVLLKRNKYHGLLRIST